MIGLVNYSSEPHSVELRELPQPDTDTAVPVKSGQLCELFVPPYLPHLEANMSTTEELWWLACRTPENIVVNLPDIADALLAGYRRT